MQTESNNVYVPTNGTINVPNIVPATFPNVCPGCGRCRDCGHPYPAPQPQPYSPYTPFTPPGPGVWMQGGQSTVCINSTATNDAQNSQGVAQS